MSELPKSAEQIFRNAFERLKANNPINLPKGSKVTQNKVAEEAGKHPTALKKDRFPLLVLEIQEYIKKQESEKEVQVKKQALIKKRTLEQRLQACQLQRNQLASICEAQLNLIEDLQDEINKLKNGITKPIPIKKDN